VSIVLLAIICAWLLWVTHPSDHGNTDENGAPVVESWAPWLAWGAFAVSIVAAFLIYALVVVR
jgi:hypothetical protein